jgi:hypothetical protein
MTKYRVRVAMVAVKTSTPTFGTTMMTLYEGNLLPDDVEQAALDHLLGMRLIEPIEVECGT